MFNVKRLAKYLATGEMPEMTDLDESLAEHDKKYHPDGYKDGDHCNKRETMAGGDGVDVDVEGKNKDNGNSMILFHGGTDNERPWDGMWLTDNEKYAEGFGDVKRYAVRLGKVFDAGNIESNDIERWISSVENRLGIGKEDLKKQASGYEYPSQIINNGLLDSYLVKNGYDSISCIEGNGNARSYMVLDSKNISLASEGETNKRRIGVTAEEDAAYLDAVKRGDMETCAKMVREAAKAMPNVKFKDKDGSPLKLYHGTPSGGFNRFKTDTVYLSSDKNYAKRYESPSASSIRFGKQATNPMTMAVYAFSQRPFDTRKADCSRAFYEKYVPGGEEWNPTSGSYTKLSKRSLPDWTEAENLRDFLVATRRKNDAIIVDEGGYFDMNGNVVDRGISYVVIDPKIIKSADPVTYDDDGQPIPLSRRFDFSSDDIRY